jgi:hypothetical protein
MKYNEQLNGRATGQNKTTILSPGYRIRLPTVAKGTDPVIITGPLTRKMDIEEPGESVHR